MAFSDQTEFARGHTVLTGLSSTPQTLFAANTSFKITHLVYTTPSGTRRITFREVGGGATILVLGPFNDTSEAVPGWQTGPGGVEVLTNSGTADVDITVFTVEDT